MAKILIIDDERSIRNTLKDILEFEKHQVVLAENGKVGLEQALSAPFDVIFSDIKMPEMDGIQLCAAIRENLNIAYTPIILLTAKNDVEHQIEGYEVGADLYVPKPFSLKLLELNVSRLISHKIDVLKLKNDSSVDDNANFLSANLREGIKDSKDREFLRRLNELILESLEDTDYSVEKLCRELAVGRTKLYTKGKDLSGQPLGDLIRDIRLNKSAYLLKNTDMNITEIIYEVGFGSNSHFSKAFKAKFGMTPTEYAKQ